MVARGLLALAVVLSQFSAASSGANRRLQETPELEPEPAPPPPPPPPTTYPNIELSFYSDASCSTAGGAMVGVTPVSRATVATSGACSPLWVWTGERPVVVAHLTGAFSASGSFDFTAYEADDTGCAGVIRDTGAMQTDGALPHPSARGARWAECGQSRRHRVLSGRGAGLLQEAAAHRPRAGASRTSGKRAPTWSACRRKLATPGSTGPWPVSTLPAPEHARVVVVVILLLLLLLRPLPPDKSPLYRSETHGLLTTRLLTAV